MEGRAGKHTLVHVHHHVLPEWRLRRRRVHARHVARHPHALSVRGLAGGRHLRAWPIVVAALAKGRGLQDGSAQTSCRARDGNGRRWLGKCTLYFFRVLPPSLMPPPGAAVTDPNANHPQLSFKNWGGGGYWRYGRESRGPGEGGGGIQLYPSHHRGNYLSKPQGEGGSRTRDWDPPPPVTQPKPRSGPQRVRMSSGERPIGTTKGNQSDTDALCHPAPL